MKSTIIAAAIALFTLTGAANAAIISSISNGNFEQGTTGWVISGNAAVVGQYGAGFNWGGGSVAQNGKYAVSFNAGDSAPNGVVYQNFATIVGASYTLQFDYGTTSPSAQSLNWAVQGTGLQNIAGGTVVDRNTSGLLDTYQFAFVANSVSSQLRFSDYSGNYTYSNDALLDNISVTANPVPEPGSLALLGLGVFGVALARRRKAC
jgi:hypothetical protein